MELRIIVEKTVLPTYDELCQSYDRVDYTHCSDTFELHESIRDLAPPTGEIAVRIKRFNRATDPEKAIAWGEKRGLRALFPWEREALLKDRLGLLSNEMGLVDLGLYRYEFGQGKVFPWMFQYGEGRVLGCTALDMYSFDDCCYMGTPLPRTPAGTGYLFAQK